MAFTDSNNTIFESIMKTGDTTTLNCSLIENKKSGIIRMNIREFKDESASGGYSGPTRNGMLIRINSAEDIDKYQKQFNDFFEEVKKHI